jgi:hypothetical protein
MRRGTIIELIPKGQCDFSEVMVDYANGRRVDLSCYELKLHSSPIDSFRREFLDYVREFGFSAYMRRGALLEEVVPPTHPMNQIEELLRDFLRKIGVDNRLVIVDPYFLAPAKDMSYTQVVENVLSEAANTLKELHLVTNKKVDANVYSDIQSRLLGLNSNLHIINKTSDSFHDRFWINPDSGKGFLTGTSLNGLGKRYAVIDHLADADVQSILSALVAEALL